MIHNLLSEVTGIQNAKSAIQRLLKDPAMTVEFYYKLEKIKHKNNKLNVQDRASARARDHQTRSKYGHNWRADAMLSIAVCGLASCMLILIYWPSISGEAVGMITTASGLFCSCIKDAFSFEFSTSFNQRSIGEGKGDYKNSTGRK